MFACRVHLCPSTLVTPLRTGALAWPCVPDQERDHTASHASEFVCRLRADTGNTDSLSESGLEQACERLSADRGLEALAAGNGESESSAFRSLGE